MGSPEERLPPGVIKRLERYVSMLDMRIQMEQEVLDAGLELIELFPKEIRAKRIAHVRRVFSDTERNYKGAKRLLYHTFPELGDPQ